MDVIEGICLFCFCFCFCFWTLHVASMLKIAFRSAILYFFLFFFCIHKYYHDTPPELLSFPHSAYSALFFPTFPTPTPFSLAMTRFKGKSPDFLQSFVSFRSICALRSLFFFFTSVLQWMGFVLFLYCYICIFVFHGSNCVAVVFIFVQHARIRWCCIIFLFFFFISWVYLHAVRLRLRVFFFFHPLCVNNW